MEQTPKELNSFTNSSVRFAVQSLDTLGRLGDVKGNMRSMLDKLKGIKADLVLGNEGWKDRRFLQ